MFGFFETGSHCVVQEFRLVLNALCTPGWPQSCDDPLASVSQVLELVVCATTPSSPFSLPFFPVLWTALASSWLSFASTLPPQ